MISVSLDDVGAPDAPVDFNDQEATDFIIHEVADAAALAALDPVVGKFAFQVDTLSAYICTVAV